MHFAIIAAGEGSRLREEGILQPKPLVHIQGVPMIDRLMNIMCRCDAESISVICNNEMVEVQQHLKKFAAEHPEVPLNLVVESTPSSMHSLACLSEVIPAGKVCVTTVDTIFREEDFKTFVSAFQSAEGGLFAVTPFVDDEKPLWVEVSTNESKKDSDFTGSPILGFYDHESEMPVQAPRLVSGGIYGLETHSAWSILHQCLAEGKSRMRNYQRSLIHAGIQLQAYVFDKIMDIDHASDIAKAEEWLDKGKSKVQRVLAILRAPEFSPNNVTKDAAILQAVVDKFTASGCEVKIISEDEFAALSNEECQHYDLVIHMARRMSSLHKLSMLDMPIVNRPQNVRNVSKSRELTFTLLQQSSIPLPGWWAYDPEEDEMFQCEPELQQLLPGWVKAMRPDGARPGDVALAETPLQADSHIITLAEQHVPDIIVTRHVEGDLLKAYVVMPGPESRKAGKQMFLNTFYPQEHGYSKFGKAEQHNSPLARTPYDQDELERIAQGIGVTLGLSVFGFDAIVQGDGKIVVIDVNDWPSYSICRQEAADAIFEMYD